MCTINDNHITYGSWDTKHNRQNFLSFWTIFCPLTPLKTHNIKILKKWKKIIGSIIILQMCIIDDNHMMHGSWDIEHDEQNFSSFWTIFCPFTPLTTQKIKFWKIEKIPGDIIILHKCTKNHDHMLYCSLDMACNYLPNNPKNHGDIIISQ